MCKPELATDVTERVSSLALKKKKPEADDPASGGKERVMFYSATILARAR